MKLLYLIAGTYRAAGMEKVLADKANWLVAHGYEVVIATTDQRGQAPAFALDPAIRTVDLGIDYEATNGANELYGTDRMLNALNSEPDAQPGQILANVMNDINAFVDGAEQFDDITMLCFRYMGPS